MNKRTLLLSSLSLLGLGIYAYRRSILARLLGLPPPRFAVRVERKIPVAMPDGVCLYADHYAPTAEGEFPTILIRTPYGRGKEDVYLLSCQDVLGPRHQPLGQAAQEGNDAVGVVGAMIDGMAVGGRGPESTGGLADVFDGAPPVWVEMGEQAYLWWHYGLLQVLRCGILVSCVHWLPSESCARGRTGGGCGSITR